MALLFTIISGIFSSVSSATARLAVLTLNLVWLQIMVQKNLKDMIWHLKSFKEQGTNGMRIE